MDKTSALAALGALAHPIRLDAFRALVVAGEAGLTPGVLVERLGVPYAKLGFHLKDLVAAGLVVSAPSGRNVIYRAVYPQMNALLGFLTENCCEGAACAVDPPSTVASTTAAPSTSAPSASCCGC